MPVFRRTEERECELVCLVDSMFGSGAVLVGFINKTSAIEHEREAIHLMLYTGFF